MDEGPSVASRRSSDRLSKFRQYSGAIEIDHAGLVALSRVDVHDRCAALEVLPRALAAALRVTFLALLPDRPRGFRALVFARLRRDGRPYNA